MTTTKISYENLVGLPELDICRSTIIFGYYGGHEEGLL